MKLRKQMQIVFQDPFSSLNPRILVRDIIGEPMKIHGLASARDVDQKVLKILEKVGLMPEHMRRYPHEFSGGQRQRIVIARVLGLNPKFIVLDEPTSSLDVSVQAQILNLLIDLQNEFGLTYLFITHNLDVVKHMSDRVAVMYLGKIVELAATNELYYSPKHPYTQALLTANPILDPNVKRELVLLKGEPTTPIHPPAGCRFHERCIHSMSSCSKAVPSLVDVGNGHFVACQLFD
jgi:oligopeptide/dipeptide ABC transporter ATP-binding protein